MRREWYWLLLSPLLLAACAAPSTPDVRTDVPMTELPAVPTSASPGAPTTAPTSAPPAERRSAPDILSNDCTRFVSPDGDDAGDGSQGAPWASFQHAADAARPGEVVCFRSGTYAVEPAALTVSGSEGAPITFAGYPGEVVVLDGQNTSSGILDFAPGASYLRISGFTLTGYTIWAINVPGGNHDLQLDHLVISGGEAAIHFTLGESGADPENGPVERVTVEDSLIRDVLYTAVDCTPGPCSDMVFRRLEISGAGMQSGEASFGADALAVERGQNLLVEDNVIHDNGGDGIDLNSRDREGSVQGVIVRRNLVYRNRLQAIKLWSGGTMESNVIWGQGINPVMIGVYPGDYVVAHNTIAYNMWDASFSARDYAFVAAYPETGESAAINLTLVNNIFAFNTGPDVGTPTGLYLGEGVTIVLEDGNLFYSRDDCEIEANHLPDRDDPCITQADIENGVWADITGGAASQTADPQFVAGWPEVDLHLREGSPAVDQGAADPGLLDADSRPRDDRPDAGAYEF